jgi:hypothetical protein
LRGKDNLGFDKNNILSRGKDNLGFDKNNILLRGKDNLGFDKIISSREERIT